MKQMAAAFVIALAILATGCVLYDYKTGQPIPSAEKLGITNLSLNISGPPICKELPGPNPCYCMFCENKTPWQAWVPILTYWYDSSLVGGNCNFTLCNASSFVEAVDENDELQARVFMLGQGPGFYSAGRANLYCNYSLQLATKWLIGNTTPPKIPQKEAAKCWLERNILPVYIYYSGGKAIDPVQTGNIAHALDGAGPAIITTELVFNSSDPSALDKVKQQIVAIKTSCPKCLSVLAVQSGDTEALRLILNDTTLYSGKTLWNLTDMVGFGFRANDYPTCDGRAIISDNLLFSRHILRTYGKPTIWLYVGASEGNSSDARCVFDAGAVHNFYQDLFKATQGLASSGVVGASFYEFYDRSGPLPCNGIQGCDFGVVLANGSQKHPEMNTWSGLCQFFATEDYRSPLIFSRNGQGSVCDYFANWKMARAVSTEVNSQAGLNYGEVLPLEPEAHVGCGQICVSNSTLSNPGIFGIYSTTFNESFCGIYPFMDDRADDYDISQAYFRAIVAVESGFNHTAVSCVNDTNMGCNPDNRTMAQICADSGNPAGCPSDFTCDPGYKPCGFGLSQCTEYPGQYYVANGQIVPGNLSACGGENYNPFDPGQSICCGTNKFSSYLSTARKFIYNNWGVLSACDNGLKDEDREWAAYFIASAYYNAGTAAVPRIIPFADQRDKEDMCGGEQNYISFLRSRGFRSYGPYASAVMSKYLSALAECDIDCPS